MVYPTLTDNFNLATLNANFLELYNQMNVKQSYTPTASNLGTITVHTAMVKSGIGRYKLIANSGTWAANTGYNLCTLSAIYRPTVFFRKDIVLNSIGGILGQLTIFTDGSVIIAPRVNITANAIFIDETYII